MKLSWSFFKTGELIPVESLRALKSSTSLKKKKSVSQPEAKVADAIADAKIADAIADAKVAEASVQAHPQVVSLPCEASPSLAPERCVTAVTSPWSPFSEPYSFLESLTEDWNLESLTLSGDVTEQKGGSLFYADFGESRDRFSKVMALGFQHDDAFSIEPVTDGDNLSLRASGAFPILSSFSEPKVLDVRTFEKHDSWKVAIVLSCLVHCCLRDMFKLSIRYRSWLHASFERVDPLQICVNKHLLSDAKQFAAVLFQEFCSLVQ